MSRPSSARPSSPSRSSAISHVPPSPLDHSQPIASTSQLPPPIPASLSMLPPELKALIVKHVYEADLDDEEQAENEGDWSDEDEVEDVDSDDEEEDDDPVFRDAVSGGEKARKAWEILGSLPMTEDGDPAEEALEKVRLRLLKMADFGGIESLTLVSREFSEMAFQWQWRELDFEAVSNEAILHLITHVLPRHAHHVQSLAFGQAEATMLRTDEPGVPYAAVDPYLPLPPARAAIVEAAEAFDESVSATLEDGTSLSSEVRSRRTRSLLVAEVIRQCRSIVRVDCEAFPAVPAAWMDEDLVQTDLDNRNVVYPMDHALSALKQYLGPNLTDLTLLVQDDGVTTESEVASVLSSCPNLLRLELEALVPSGPPAHRTALFDAFTAFTSLEALNIVEGTFITDDFALLPLDHWPLKVLALAECEDLSFPSFHTLVHRFKRTLECLDLAGAPHSNHARDTKKYLRRPFDLPKLDTLVLETTHESPFLLEAFAACPLRTFGLGFCPAVTYADVERFITEVHGETLKRVEVAHDAALTAGQVESLEVLCHAKGLECVLMPDEDSDSEHTSDDDASVFDGLDETDSDLEDGDDDAEEDDNDAPEQDHDGWMDDVDAGTAGGLVGEEEEVDAEGEDGWLDQEE